MTPPQTSIFPIDLRPEEKGAFYRLFDEARLPFEEQHAAAFEAMLLDMGGLMAEAIERQGSLEAADEMAEASSILILPKLQDMAMDVVPFFAQQVESAVKALPIALEEKQVSRWLQAALDWIAQWGGRLVREITDTNRAQVQQILRQAQEEGLGMDEAARLLRREWDELSPQRALRIVRTEIPAMSNYGSLVGAIETDRDLGLGLRKEWIATGDGRTRETHRAADEQQVGLDEAFTVGGFPALYPGDPNLPIGERALCRCTLAFVTPDDE